ncbi:hypothetical protein DLM78_18750 [Leptospira stimsonii]|uniref:Uncharacterized protein n=1 Tax=Leptospira stimsonii TaxID=2202203 RepID=A0A8B3CLI7_9LEPT|nr:hypothetical protein DLM78_18750 [Leptospira stimsonii]
MNFKHSEILKVWELLRFGSTKKFPNSRKSSKIGESSRNSYRSCFGRISLLRFDLSGNRFGLRQFDFLRDSLF